MHDISHSLNDLPLWSAPFGLKLLETVKFRQKAIILDIGCGLGFPAIELAMRFGKDAFVYGIDPWVEGLAAAKTKAETMGVKNIRFLKQNAENPDFEDHFFDLITANNGLNNVQDPEKMLQECYRMCKPGAQAVFTMNTDATMKEFYKIFEAVLLENNLHESVLSMQKHIHEKRKSVEETKEMLMAAGFSINQCITDIFYLRYLDGTSMLSHSWIDFVFVPGWKSIIDESNRKTVFTQLENKLNEYAGKQGELKLSIPFVTFDCIKTP